MSLEAKLFCPFMKCCLYFWANVRLNRRNRIAYRNVCNIETLDRHLANSRCDGKTLSKLIQIGTTGASTALSYDEYWQIPLSNNTWVVSKQMGTIYEVPIHASRYILSNVDIVRTRMCACMCTLFWVHFIWCVYVTKYVEVNVFKIQYWSLNIIMFINHHI